MSTVNQPLSKNWLSVVPAGNEFLLSAIDCVIEVATSAGAPTLNVGHVVSPYERESMSRALIGPGEVWARIAPSQTLANVEIALTVW